MAAVTNEPGEARDHRSRGSGRRLDQAPSARYVAPEGMSGDDGGSLVGPLARAAIAAVLGAGLLFIVGAVVAETAGLVFVSGVMGAAIGLLLSRGTVAESGPPGLTRRTAAWLAIGLAAGAVVAAWVATWLYARQEGGTLGLLDYLLQAFGPFVPGELLVAALGAAWGASSGPVRRS